MGDIHRIGGGGVENLRLKPAEEKLDPPGISVLKRATPAEVAAEVRAAFPGATKLHEAASTIGTTTEESIRLAGFEIIADPTRRFPNHHRIIHREGVAGFTEENLRRLSAAFEETQEN
ncbi:MAG: hypothetical protein P4L84_09005 [Isosphaeraceae bacterium]|nr:hypothetical protein [Isosphaeraceae bacterium]